MRNQLHMYQPILDHDRASFTSFRVALVSSFAVQNDACFLALKLIGQTMID